MKTRILYICILFSFSKCLIAQDNISYNILKIDTITKDDRQFFLIELEYKSGKFHPPRIPDDERNTYDTKFDMRISTDSACKPVLISFIPTIGIKNEKEWALAKLKVYYEEWVKSMKFTFYYKGEIIDCDIFRKSENNYVLLRVSLI